MEALLRLKQPQLKVLSVLLGTSATGTKSFLAESLVATANRIETRPPFTVLSVDMGVRNLSLCHFEVPENLREAQVTGWSRLDIEKEFRPKTWPESVSSFDPDRLAQITHDLVQERFYTHDTKKLPDVILIERQRFRSGSSTAILEWTVRVNMLENMLHAVLYASSRQNNLDSNIMSVNAKRILSYWKEEVNMSKIKVPEANDSLRTYKKTKDLKTKIATSVIQSSPSSMFSSAAILTRDQVLSAKGKNDDLADSLLQGLAWLQWQNNRKTLKDLLAGQCESKNLYTAILSSFGI